MIGSSANRATFISSVVDCLSQYNLDGIGELFVFRILKHDNVLTHFSLDIDFGNYVHPYNKRHLFYPIFQNILEQSKEMPHREVRFVAISSFKLRVKLTYSTDTPNLTAFFMELRQALGSKLISCGLWYRRSELFFHTYCRVAAPAGYWFLKGFEIDAIATYVDFINMMCELNSPVLLSWTWYSIVLPAYDYHGPWDVNVTGQAPVTNPQTSILDINTSTLLYTRAGVDLQKGMFSIFTVRYSTNLVTLIQS